MCEQSEPQSEPVVGQAQKLWAEMENFSGKSALAVRQDFFAKIVTLNLAAMFVSAAQHEAGGRHASRKNRYRINFAQALSKMKDNLILLIHGKAFQMQERIGHLIGYISKTVEAVRQNHRFARKKRGENLNIKHMQYKRCR